MHQQVRSTTQLCIHLFTRKYNCNLYLLDATTLTGRYIFFNEAADSDMREAYIPFFAWLDVFVYVSACFTVKIFGCGVWREVRGDNDIALFNSMCQESFSDSTCWQY